MLEALQDLVNKNTPLVARGRFFSEKFVYFFVFGLVWLIDWVVRARWLGWFVCCFGVSALRVPPGGNQVDGLPPAQHSCHA